MAKSPTAAADTAVEQRARARHRSRDWRDTWPLWKHRLRTRLDAWPAVFPLQARLRGKRALVIRRDTELVIEGYPRSGNTFAVAAFRLAQPTDVRLARHMHAPAQIALAARWRIPALLLLRDPVDAVISMVIRTPFLTVAQALSDYVFFHERLLPYRRHFVVGRFEEVTGDYGAVLRRLNAKFGTSFVPFEHTAENEARALELVERMEREDSGDSVVRETHVARPSSARAAEKEVLAAALAAPEVQRLVARARSVHRELAEL